MRVCVKLSSLPGCSYLFFGTIPGADFRYVLIAPKNLLLRSLSAGSGCGWGGLDTPGSSQCLHMFHLGTGQGEANLWSHPGKAAPESTADSLGAEL